MSRKNQINLETYIHKELRRIHPDTYISKEATDQLNYILNQLGDRISEISDVLSERVNRSTNSSLEIQNATKIVLSGELAKHAVHEGVKAVTKYTSA